METRKLYYEDCHLRQFTGRVLACEESEKGWWVTLNQTAFYPEGGGQACDLGTLGHGQVLDVREKDGQVRHLCSVPLEVGEEAAGQIQWERRFDLMQQHTGEHIISGLLHSRFGFHNVGFHIGKEVMEVDFDGMISPEELAQVEAAANEAVWMNLPLKCWYPSRQELPEVVYRSKRALDWPVRIVQVPGYDSCACCGVHTAMTGEVGLIKILSWTKFHQGIRLEMVCGGRAYRYLSEVLEQNRLVSQTFSAKMLETGTAAGKIAEALAAEKFRSAGLEKRIFDTVAKQYAGQEFALHLEPGLSGGSLRELADKIAQVCGTAAVFTGDDRQGYSYCLASRTENLSELNKQMNQALNGRGGGKPNFQQGSVKAGFDEITAFFGKIMVEKQ